MWAGNAFMIYEWKVVYVAVIITAKYLVGYSMASPDLQKAIWVPWKPKTLGKEEEVASI